jgi:hypothetical protein
VPALLAIPAALDPDEVGVAAGFAQEFGQDAGTWRSCGLG